MSSVAEKVTGKTQRDEEESLVGISFKESEEKEKKTYSYKREQLLPVGESCRIKEEFSFVFQMRDITAGFYADENGPAEKEEFMLMRKERIARMMFICRQKGM